MTDMSPLDLVKKAFADAGIAARVDAREYPDESIFVAHVQPDMVQSATAVSNKMDAELQARGVRGFITVRSEVVEQEVAGTKRVRSVGDSRVSALVDLLTARSRASEAQPSLVYVRDVGSNLPLATSPRHHLVFGRRGAGKTALLLEARRVVTSKGDSTLWLNLQTHRNAKANGAFLWSLLALADVVITQMSSGGATPRALQLATALRADLEPYQKQKSISDADVALWVPRAREMLKRYLAATAGQFFLFIDDLHYIDRQEQPRYLDLLHGAVRDIPAWLKIAAIKHVARWYIASPPTGLQTGHDADHIELDLTLERPADAKSFLEEMLLSYARHVGVNSLGSVFRTDALDRLVLACGGVPRDYMVLSAGALREARKRVRVRAAGVQDVNRAAGNVAQVKIVELEDDAASDHRMSQSIVLALNWIRDFCLDDERCTFFRIGFREKESHPVGYSLIQGLMDLRLIHLINSSVSDQHEAGSRYEAYMLDLSQFSGQRLKKYLRVLDFQDGDIAAKETGTTQEPRIAKTPRQLITILRSGPALDLGRFEADSAPKSLKSKRKPAR